MNRIIVKIILLVKHLFMLIIVVCLKNLNQVTRLSSLKLVIESGLLNIKIFLANVALTNSQKKHF